MKKQIRITSLLLSLVMILALLPTTVMAASVITCSIAVDAPVEGDIPATTAAAKHSSSSRDVKWFSVTKVEWSGELDSNGCFKAGKAYTVTFTAQMSDDYPDYEFRSSAAYVNKKTTRQVTVSSDKKTLTSSYTFDTVKSNEQIANEKEQREAENRAEMLASRWSLAEADANYPLGSPITLLVNEETLKDTDIEQFGTYAASGAIIRSLYGHNDKFYTLDGETIENRGLSTIGMNTTANHYRVTRVVYDYYRADDPSLDRFPNCTELWLSPKCDVDGILKTLGNITLSTQFEGDFFTQNCTVFIPDSLYPNGPTYTNHPAPGCRVMLYSGDDVYAAAQAGKEHARDWCTNHSYTYKYISEDRRYTYPTCITDARFYYSCSKCGKCEYNPNHTFYPTVGTFDNGEDGGKNTAHSFHTKVVTDEHFLGYNADGDRVYLYVCENCGKDSRQSASADEKKFWVTDSTGAWYHGALKATAGKDSTRHSYAISNSDYIAAKQNAWATGEVLAASEEGLIDASLMGDDYTRSINRLQFSSIAVKMAEKMAGKTITPAPSGTFMDTDNEYVRKAAAAGIIQSVDNGLFEPNGTLNRQQMAAFLYRALQWVKNNSDTEYTVYTPELGKYSDAGQLESWAVEAMGFMNTLGLIHGTSGTTLSPNDICTIEQAIAVACRSLDAGGIGWYQYVEKGRDWLHYGDRLWVYFKNSKACCVNPYGFESAGLNLEGGGFRPIKDIQ